MDEESSGQGSDADQGLSTLRSRRDSGTESKDAYSGSAPGDDDANFGSEGAKSGFAPEVPNPDSTRDGSNAGSSPAGDNSSSPTDGAHGDGDGAHSGFVPEVANPDLTCDGANVGSTPEGDNSVSGSTTDGANSDCARDRANSGFVLEEANPGTTCDKANVSSTPDIDNSGSATDGANSDSTGDGVNSGFVPEVTNPTSTCDGANAGSTTEGDNPLSGSTTAGANSDSARDGANPGFVPEVADPNSTCDGANVGSTTEGDNPVSGSTTAGANSDSARDGANPGFVPEVADPNSTCDGANVGSTLEGDNSVSGSTTDGANSDCARDGANSGFVLEEANPGTTCDKANVGSTPDIDNSGSATDSANSDSTGDGVNSGFVPEAANPGSTCDGANVGSTPEGDNPVSGSTTAGANSDTARDGTNSGFVPEEANPGSTCDKANVGSTPDIDNSGSATDGANSDSTGDGVNSGFVPEAANPGSTCDGANVGSTTEGDNPVSGSTTAGANSDTVRDGANSGFVPEEANPGSTCDKANVGSTPDIDNSGSATDGANSDCARDRANSGFVLEEANPGTTCDKANVGSTPDIDNSGSATDGANSDSTGDGVNSGFVPEAANPGSTCDGANVGSTPEGDNSVSGSTTDSANSDCARDCANPGFVPEVADPNSTCDGANVGSTLEGDNSVSGSTTDGANSDCARDGANSGFVPEEANPGTTCDKANVGSTPDIDNSGSAADGANSDSTGDGVNSGFVPEVVNTGSTCDNDNTNVAPGNAANSDSIGDGAKLGSVPEIANPGSISESSNAGSAPGSAYSVSTSDAACSSSTTDGGNSSCATDCANAGLAPEVTNPSSVTDSANARSTPDATNSGSATNIPNSYSAPGDANTGFVPEFVNPNSATDSANDGSTLGGTKAGTAPEGANSASATNGANSSQASETGNAFAHDSANTASRPVGANSSSGSDRTEPVPTSSSSGTGGVYRPPSMRARLQNQDGGTPFPVRHALMNSSIPTDPTFEQYLLQQVKEKKTIGPFSKYNARQNNTRSVFERHTSRSEEIRTNQRFNRNEFSQRKQQNTYVRYMSCSFLAEIARSESVVIIEKINRQKESFKKLLDTTPDDRSQDVFALVFELVTNVWKSSFEESKKLLLLEICNSKFIDHLQLYLMQLPYKEDGREKDFNKHYWTKEKEFWSNFMTFCESVLNVSPSTAVRKCGALIEATSKSCLVGLKDKHDFELPADYINRMTNLRDALKKQAQSHKKSNTRAIDEPLESFRELTVLPTGSELLERRPFLRANVVEGAYSDVEHYLDVQFRLLREDCFGPLREGIHQYIESPKQRKYDNIRVYRNVQFLEPYFSKQKFGSLVLLDHYTEKMFKKINWKQSKRFLFGSLVLFTKDNCQSFLVGTILERDEEFLSQRMLGVSIIDSTMESDLYNDDLYTMIECDVYFEPYHHVLQALQDPSFPEHLAMSKYIVDVQKVPENPAYLTPHTVYAVKTKNGDDEKEFSVLQDKTWPSETSLGLDSTQYEAYKLALSNEFAVIQGPPGTGKTFLGVKIARTLLENAPCMVEYDQNVMLVICYTNHALDQFLEALLPITESIVRIGGRSQSKLLEAYNINNLRNRSCYSERFHLEDSILELKNVHEACVSNEILLSYDTIVAFAKECDLIYKFYRRQWSKTDSDVLRRWLFEDVDSVEYFDLPFLVDSVQIKENENVHKNENKEVDNDIYARDDFVVDDNNELSEELRNMRFRCSKLVSFSLSDVEGEINKNVEKYQSAKKDQQNLDEQDPHYNDDYYDRILQDLEGQIIEMQSQIKVFRDMMLYQTRAPRIKLTDVKDLSTIPRIERWSYYFKWANIAKAHLKAEVKIREEKVKSAAKLYEEARMMVDRAVLRGSKVVGMTTSAAARLRKLLVDLSPPIVVVEEAAEVLEAHIVTSLTKSCQHLILIGDHQQLRPSAACMRLARHYQLEVSLFERMIRNGVHSRRLGVQHRMRPEIAALVAPSIYPDLRNHRSVEDFPPVRGVAHNLFFFSHDYMEENEDDNSSRTNILEADFTLRLANYLMQQGYKPHEVTIVAAYSGQMFYMRRQRSLYDHLSDVKITVLDNYQGEESKIILLSLVRNNSTDNIGFLGTENRICVALSRAREGFFIFGNIELLKRNSTLWTNIAQILAKNGSLGSTLKLKCENHDGQITVIKSLEDFMKVPEGGCLLDCKFNLPACGHPCPRMCHSYDLAHVSIACTRDCERKICEIEGHNCPLGCARTCRPCERYMDKVLPCGHTRAIACHIAPDDPAAYCAENVDVTLPGCGHKATKPCSQRISDVRCLEKCESGRLSCGHACTWKCHVNDDPEHEKYTCFKPCPRPKKRCTRTANLEGDLGDHKCPLLCWEACQPCDVQVTKKRSGCKHSKRMACSEDVDAELCREKCARSLPCGHHCKKLCFEKCGDCIQKVKKSVPECDHEVEIECGTDPSREHCTHKCERTMACGHACPSRCAQPCDQTACTEITEHSSEAPCGHSVKLPCNVYQLTQNGTVSDKVLLALCTAPCGMLLLCGHSCSGSCAGCRQGRLHQPCAARCQQLNICGHMCSEPCNQVCPPCRQLCAVACPHSRCGKLCGAPCTPCTEAECGRACEHEACTRACGQVCDRAPCERACPRALGCGHPCRGLCGEPCPPVCRLCDPDNFPTDLLGDPYDDDDKLIQLQDCPHILDVDTLDTLMKSQNETIQIKTCPFCREPIINTYRYKDLVNKMLRYDVNPIKEKVYGTEHQRSKMREELTKKIADLKEKLTKENKYWMTAFESLRSVVKKNTDLSVLHLDMYHTYLDLLVTVRQYCEKYSTERLIHLTTEMKDQVKLVCGALEASKQKISQQQQADIGKEMQRMNSIVQLSMILKFSKCSTNPEVEEMAKTATEAVLTWRVYDEEIAVECMKKLEKAVKLSGIASKEEREMVVRAIGLKAGHWYKCPNGHFYCIGECGGAMQVSRCPECGATIGGERHTLTAGNQHAGEVDGSRFAAWSQEANNMANFQLD